MYAPKSLRNMDRKFTQACFFLAFLGVYNEFEDLWAAVQSLSGSEMQD